MAIGSCRSSFVCGVDASAASMEVKRTSDGTETLTGLFVRDLVAPFSRTRIRDAKSKHPISGFGVTATDVGAVEIPADEVLESWEEWELVCEWPKDGVGEARDTQDIEPLFPPRYPEGFERLMMAKEGEDDILCNPRSRR